MACIGKNELILFEKIKCKKCFIEMFLLSVKENNTKHMEENYL